MSNIFFDIGTHTAQELFVLTGKRSFILYHYFLWWSDWFFRVIKSFFLRNRNYSYGVGRFKVSPVHVSFEEHLKLISLFIKGTNFIKDIKIFSIDPNFYLTPSYLKDLPRNMDITYLPIVLPFYSESKCCDILPFYITPDGLSSSLSPVKNSNKLFIPMITFRCLLNYLSDLGLLTKDSNFYLRLNCEGAEFSVIDDALRFLNTSPVILGSINDVSKKFGSESLDSLHNLISHSGSSFIYFKGTDPSTWLSSVSIFSSMVNK